MSRYADYPEFDQSLAEINRIKQSVDDMKIELTKKGVYVPSSSKLVDVPKLIEEIDVYSLWDGDEYGGFTKVLYDDGHYYYIDNNAAAIGFISQSTGVGQAAAHRDDDTTATIYTNRVLVYWSGKNMSGAATGWTFGYSGWQKLIGISAFHDGMTSFSSYFFYTAGGRPDVTGTLRFPSTVTSIGSYFCQNTSYFVGDFMIECPAARFPISSSCTFSGPSLTKGIGIKGTYANEFLTRFPNASNRNFYKV